LLFFITVVRDGVLGGALGQESQLGLLKFVVYFLLLLAALIHLFVFIAVSLAVSYTNVCFSVQASASFLLSDRLRTFLIIVIHLI